MIVQILVYGIFIVSSFSFIFVVIVVRTVWLVLVRFVNLSATLGSCITGCVDRSVFLQVNIYTRFVIWSGIIFGLLLLLYLCL